MNASPSSLPVIVAGGGIGGLAAALALVRQGFAVKVLEQAPSIGEIGAGIQLGANAFAAFDAIGIGARAGRRAVYPYDMSRVAAGVERAGASVAVGVTLPEGFVSPYAVHHS